MEAGRANIGIGIGKQPDLSTTDKFQRHVLMQPVGRLSPLDMTTDDKSRLRAMRRLSQLLPCKFGFHEHIVGIG